MKIVLLGPPGSGKGTQAKALAEKYGLTLISTGDLLRREVKDRTELGKRIESYMNEGSLVPNEVVIGLIRSHLRGKEGFILDGFPRNLAQAKSLEKMLREIKLGLDRVIYFKVEQDELVRRLSRRRTCSHCQAVYHLVSKPPKQEDICDRCGGTLFQREDDQPSSVTRRFDVYVRETKPLIAYYKEAELLTVIGGEGGPAEVRLKVQQVLSQIQEAAREQISG